MKNVIYIFFLLLIIPFIACKSDKSDIKPPPQKEVPKPLTLGYSVGITTITSDKMEKAKAAGIEYVEAAGMNPFFDDNRSFTKTAAEAELIMNNAKNAANSAGVKIWSVHMPYGANMDFSAIDETVRKSVVEAHKKLIGYLKILQPKIILFHPSYYLDPPNQRDQRKSQMIKSANELNEAVMAIGATMVLENLLGPELMLNNVERPLMRTVDETAEIFNRLPASIGLGVDMNHIENPEILVRRMGSRVKTLHVSDGSGRAENHYFPCSGEGKNNWVEILKSLNEIGYQGPFMYECAYNTEKDLADCYKTLYNKLIDNIK